MNERDKKLIKLFKQGKGNCTLQSLGLVFNISRERVRQILKANNLKSNKKYTKWNNRYARLFYCGLPKELRLKILKRDNFTCQYCGAKGPVVKLCIDHRKPKNKFNVSKKVCHGPSNLIVACVRCNSRKGILSEAKFRKKLRLDNIDK